MQSRIPGPTARATAATSSNTMSLSTLNGQSQTISSLKKHNNLACKSGSQKDLSDHLSQLPVMNGNIQLSSTTRHVSTISQPRNLPPTRKQTTEASSKQTLRQLNPSVSSSANDLQKVPASGNEKSLSNANRPVEEVKYHSKTSKNSTQNRTEIFLNSKGQDSSLELGNTELYSTEIDTAGSAYNSPRTSRKGIVQSLNRSPSMQKAASKIPDRGQKEEKKDSNGINSRGKVAPTKASRIAGLSHTRRKILDDVHKGVATLPPRGKCKSRFSISNDNLLHLASCGGTTDMERPKSSSSQRQWKSDVSWKSYSFSNLLLDENEDLSELSVSSVTSPKRTFTGGVKTSINSNVIKLPSPSQNSHPNTATVAPFMYKGETKRDSNSIESKDPAGHPNAEDCNWKSKKYLEDIDPETQRKRTVQNIVDLRQNLEDTMSSLRGSQITHSALDTAFDSDISAEVNARGRGTSSSNRSSPLSWRYGQASPRLQAGDAPSVGSGCQPGGNSGWFVRGDASHYSHTMPMRSSSKPCNISHLDLESLDADDVDLKSISADMSGYMSDSDLLGKTMNDDDITTGWDESSSVSSGLSDTSDNLSSEDLNASSSLNSYPTTPVASRRNSGIALRTDAEKRSMVESGLTWYSGSEGKGQKKSEGGYDASNLKMDQNTKWRRIRSESAEESTKNELKKPQSTGQTSSLKRGGAPVGVTSPMTSSGAGSLKVAGKIESKVPDKGKLALKGTSLQRSSSDASRDRVGETRKPPSGISRPSTGGSFGYKKPTTGTATVMTASGSSPSTGKTQKSTGIPVKPTNSRKTSLDVSQNHDGFMSSGARTAVQYRSLPRPAKSSSVSITGRGGVNRPVSSNIDPSLISSKHGGIPVSRLKEPSKIGMGRANSVPVNQTDREKEKAKAKAVASDTECTTTSSSTKATSAPESHSKLQGMRQPSSKFSEMSSPTAQRVMSSKGIGKPPAIANIDKINSNSLDSSTSGHASVTSSVANETLTKTPDVQTTGISLTPCLTPSPAPVLNVNSSTFSQGLGLVSNFTNNKETLMYPKLSSLHTSMESLDLPLSVPCSFSASGTLSREEDHGALTWTGSSRFSQMESAQRDRNTLPKKGLRYGTSLQQEDNKEWLHARSVGGSVDSDSQLLSSPSTVPLSNLASPTAVSQLSSPTPKMMRSNSIPTHDSSFDLYGSLQMGSTVSLAERPKGMIRSGSFRDPVDDVHGSVLSLASTTSSVHSTSEDKAQGEHIRKLRRELESSHDKVSALTSQLSTNAHLVAAFEQSLTNMTSRLQSLALTAEQKDSELFDLKETIDMLHKKNAEAQAVIHGALNNPDLTPKELRIKRQNSSDSISSLNSITSHSSIGSGKDADAKKKKKKSWLRSSFKQAFTLKKAPKPASSYSDIEEIATPDSSVPSSPKVQREDADSSSVPIKPSHSSTEVYDSREPDLKEVSNLRNELWDKERKLTDIRLEALSSAHQLEQLREAMHNMQVEIEALKLENDRLKADTGTGASQAVTLSSATSSPRRSLGLTLAHSFSLSLTDSVDQDVSPMDGVTSSSLKEERNVRIVVLLTEEQMCNETTKQQEFFIGSTKVTGTTDWTMLDGVICQLFKDYITKVDPVSCLGLSTDAIYSYSVDHVKRIFGTDAPDMLPYRYIGKESTSFAVTLKGLKEKSVDSLVFETLIPKPMMQHYISLLLKHRRLILSGPSGTGKSYLSIRLAEYLVQRSGREVTDEIIVTFNMDTHSCKDLQLYLSNLANQIDRETSTGNVPLVIILDDLSEPGSLSELVNGALTCKYHKCPYVIGTTNQPVKTTPNHGLHLSFRLVPFSNNAEPANGFLSRYLQRKLIESENDANANNTEILNILNWVPKLWYHLHTFLEMYSTSDFLIGPCFFLSSPVNVAEFREWFIDLWNYSILPYLQEGVNDGIKTYGRKAVWEDPAKWVQDTLPWSTASQDRSKIFHLPPPSTGSQVTGPPADKKKIKETAPTSLESDPLMTMLLRLQEAANYTQSCEGENILESSLQSTH
ncbi:neuron navigator 1-like isoform X1 [Carcharodon carcharias]|uniref:neuron navigator 1-like isoform X1 n=1 Tax=Carcharodon carcharias TaxID=13397 RepID=UPI001B7E9911|nr:neuron navigator 1-like isoform X1 [Carcharodon carcharias]XP_041051669.1 neuron navigator 1-like isoform X1 [Carcharodon carcharias]